MKNKKGPNKKGPNKKGPNKKDSNKDQFDAKLSERELERIFSEEMQDLPYLEDRVGQAFVMFGKGPSRGPKPSSDTNNQTRQKDWESERKELFLNYCQVLGHKPTKEVAKMCLYGEYGSIEAAEEPIPNWYWELPEK